MLSRLIVVFLVGIFFSGCSSSNEPGEADIKNALLKHSAKGMSISDIEIKANENVGSEVEPRFKTRFVLKLEVTMPLFERVERIRYNNHNIDVVREVVSKGDEFEFFGLAGSTLHNEAWKTRIVSMDSDTSPEGRLLSSFDHYVVEGSAEHEAALAKRDAWDKAEDARRVREKKDLEIARMKREEQAAKAAVERKEQEARERIEREKKAAIEQERHKIQAAKHNKDVNLLIKKINGVWKGTTEQASPVKMVVHNKVIDLKFPTFPNCGGVLYVNIDESSASQLVTSLALANPNSSCSDYNGTKHKLILLSDSTLRVDRLGKVHTSITMGRQ